MLPGGQLGNDAPVGFMNQLGVDKVGKNLPLAD